MYIVTIYILKVVAHWCVDHLYCSLLIYIYLHIYYSIWMHAHSYINNNNNNLPLCLTRAHTKHLHQSYSITGASSVLQLVLNH